MQIYDQTHSFININRSICLLIRKCLKIWNTYSDHNRMIYAGILLLTTENINAYIVQLTIKVYQKTDNFTVESACFWYLQIYMYVKAVLFETMVLLKKTCRRQKTMVCYEYVFAMRLQKVKV
jgi:uncharacterized membrane protein YcjF (UPF0283 family)